jgi:U-box domain
LDDSDCKNGDLDDVPEKKKKISKQTDPGSVLTPNPKEKQKQINSNNAHDTSFDSSNGHTSETDHIPASTALSQQQQHLWNGIIIPAMLLCPIGHQLMTDPVICADGYSYERYNIESWMVDNDKSPVTDMLLHDKELVSDQPLIKLISAIQSSANVTNGNGNGNGNG